MSKEIGSVTKVSQPKKKKKTWDQMVSLVNSTKYLKKN